jgi:cardiolipin synthase
LPLPNYLTQHWLIVSAAFNIIVALIVSAHVVLNKRDTRAAITWVGLIWLTPLFGVALYFWLGINRIKRRARLLRSGSKHHEIMVNQESCPQELLKNALSPEGHHLASISKLVNAISNRPLLAGNAVTLLQHGEQAYPAMIHAMDSAAQSIALSTYIFDKDQTGGIFLDSLKRALSRKVEVRVLIDDMGARYSWPTITQSLRKAGIRCTTFMPPAIPWIFQHTNLRTHRKLLIVDGTTGFTGGMNIRDGHAVSSTPAGSAIRDIHFQVEGPVVTQLQECFADDWFFSTGEDLTGDIWFPKIEPIGDVLARGISDGPDENLEGFRFTMLGAIASAESSIRIMTPYFLPDAALITALNVAAMRGIAVDIVLPGKNNNLLVQWASTSLLWQVVERGCRVWVSPPPFDHAKLLVVDGLVSFVGSSNWDPRSLRLNFEFNLECYSRTLASMLSSIVQDRIGNAHRYSLAELDGRPLHIKLRDGIARLASPYL